MSRNDKNVRHAEVGIGEGGRDESGDAMVRPTLTVGRAPHGTPTLVFDGDCAFCRRCAELLAARRRAPRIAAYQSAPLDEWGLRREDCERAVQWIGRDRREGARAIAAALVHCGAPWSWAGWLIAAPGVRRIADRVYRRVAERRRCRTVPPIA